MRGGSCGCGQIGVRGLPGCKEVNILRLPPGGWSKGSRRWSASVRGKCGQLQGLHHEVVRGGLDRYSELLFSEVSGSSFRDGKVFGTAPVVIEFALMPVVGEVVHIKPAHFHAGVQRE